MPHICNICSRDFKEKASLKRHLLTKKKCKKKNFFCENCQKPFSCKKSLLCHQQIYCKGENTIIFTLKGTFQEWLNPFVDLDTPITNWVTQVELHLKNLLAEEKIHFVEYEELKYILTLYCHTYGILCNYKVNLKDDLLRLLIKLLRHDKIKEDALALIISKL